jgi:hypothetical protein
VLCENANTCRPLPIYIGVMLYAATRKKSIIDRLFDLGLCVLYDRVLNLTDDLAAAVCKFYTDQNVVCPPQLHRDLFTVAAVDNLDHNPSSNTSSDSFHGTAISLFQHPHGETATAPVCELDLSGIADRKDRPRLPTWYTNVPPDASRTRESPVFCSAAVDARNDSIALRSCPLEFQWLSEVRLLIENDAVGECMTWSAHHATKSQSPSPKCLSAVLPLFPDPSHSTAMMKHAMNIALKAVEFINPGQSPVLACDQPLFATAKQVQWTWPELYSEYKIVTMLRVLHIEMAALKAAGQWLAGSGWSDSLVHCGLATRGTAESYLNASHVKRARYAHQVFVSALFIMQRRAFAKCHPNEDVDFEAWCQSRCSSCPQFLYWSLTMELELAVLVFVRSLRQSDFELYIEALDTLVPWFFALDRTNYSRWLSVHVYDMKSLKATNPSVYDSFKTGKFTFKAYIYFFIYIFIYIYIYIRYIIY